ncbi:hypothetical protein ABT186_44260 [Streptomyces sp. NPDC001634]|uniref:hypothetical protein n=1 Tax=Streptomyces sp. NPDC001634 TaxID=3154390 RepID=UPI003318EB43
MDAGLIAPVVIAAALVIRTAIAELRAPGTTRATWAFTHDPAAVAAGITVTGVAALSGGGWPSLAWGLLAGALTGHLVHQARHRRR